MWSYEIEDRIRAVLLDVDPKFEKELSGGFFYRAVPSFYNKLGYREALVYLNYYEVPSDVRILDYGCGTGQFLLYLWYHGYRNLEGRDHNNRWLEAATRLFEELAPDASFATSKCDKKDIYENLRGPDGGQYDVISMFGVISGHNIDVAKVFEPVRDALSRGGYFFLNDYLYNPEQLMVWMRKAKLNPRIHTAVNNVGGGATHFYVVQG